MAQEISVAASLTYTNTANNIQSVSLAVKTPGLFTITGKVYARELQTIPTTAGGTALKMGSITTPGWGIFKNTDAVNYIELLSAVSGTVFARLKAGEIALLRLPPGMTAPAAIANTASVSLDYLILQD